MVKNLHKILTSALFIYLIDDLFNEDVSNPEYISPMAGWLMNGELSPQKPD
jgi:hypothetical protein